MGYHCKIRHLLVAAGALSLFVISKAVAVSADPALDPVKIELKPRDGYADENRSFNMILGADITPGGRIWAAWISGGDNENAYLLAAKSEDGGQTWSEPILAIDPHRYTLEQQGAPRRRTLVGNFWTDPLGRLWLFYDQSLGYFDGRAGVWAIICEQPDAAAPTWSEPRRLFDGSLLNKPVVTKAGEWLAFPSLWPRRFIGPNKFTNTFPHLDNDRGVNTYRSLDKGVSWKHLSSVRPPPEQASFGEPSVVELENGDLWMLMRDASGLEETISKNGGLYWSQPTPSRISTAPSRVFLRRLSSGHLLLVKHGRKINTGQTRSELTAYISTNDGRSWKGGLVVDERMPISYPDGFQSPDGRIHIFYDHDRAGAAEIITSVFTEDEVLTKKFSEKNDRQRIIVNKATKPRAPKAEEAPVSNPKASSAK